MSAQNGSGVFHYAWTRGMAAVVEAPACRTAAVFGPGGWEQGQPATVLPAGVPPGAEVAHLALPEWLAEQIAGLQFSAGGLHTEFIRLELLLERLRRARSNGVVLVLGEKPSVYVVADGKVVPFGEGTTSTDVASGYIVVFSGEVRVPASPGARPCVAALADPTGGADQTDGADETFFVPAGVRDSPPEEATAGILEVAGPAGRAVPGLLDGSCTVATVAAKTGLTTRQVRAVIGVLAAQRLAFRYICRSRPASLAGSSGPCEDTPGGL